MVAAWSWMRVWHGWQGGDPSWLLRRDDLFAHRGTLAEQSERAGGRICVGWSRRHWAMVSAGGRPQVGGRVALSQGTLTWQDRP